jgi:hypothetical protein
MDIKAISAHWIKTIRAGWILEQYAEMYAQISG